MVSIHWVISLLHYRGKVWQTIPVYVSSADIWLTVGLFWGEFKRNCFDWSISYIWHPNLFVSDTATSLPDDRKFLILASGTLRIIRVSQEDAGNYECIAVNKAGQRQSMAQVEIRARGRFINPSCTLMKCFRAFWNL